VKILPESFYADVRHPGRQQSKFPNSGNIQNFVRTSSTVLKLLHSKWQKREKEGQET
jgi:hypothetical protein